MTRSQAAATPWAVAVGGDAAGGDAVGGSPPGSCDADFSCVPAIAAGSFVRALPSGDSCAEPWPSPTTYASVEQPGCATCTCGAPAPGTCSAGSLRGYSDDDCEDYLGFVSGNGCHGFGGTTHRAFRLEPSTPSASTCAPSTGSPNPIDETTVCGLAAPPAEPCGDGWVCVPDGAGDLCNLLPDDATCPAGYDAGRDIAPVTDDTRDCTGSCGPSTGQTCNATAVVYSGGSCSAGETTPIVVDSDLCIDTVDTSSGRISFDEGTWTGGSCAPEPTTGALTFGQAARLCCR